jgi:guanosine-3',5'-bis(diphosphate) 3'-pyrophosphohydrolase
VLSKVAPGVVKDDPSEGRPAGAIAEPGAPSGPAPPPPGSRRAPGDRDDGVIKVRGVDDLLVYRAKCCNPIRGESIVGYVTRGKGVAVHSRCAPTCRT